MRSRSTCRAAARARPSAEGSAAGARPEHRFRWPPPKPARPSGSLQVAGVGWRNAEGHEAMTSTQTIRRKLGILTTAAVLVGGGLGLGLGLVGCEPFGCDDDDADGDEDERCEDEEDYP